ncbi:levanase-like [Thrips palmi]|uniref:Levanase-like n=1 Tax=Thrips palmi TaxID=161013 RepID=A0A6P8XZ42_THRPL|nr:levanase-like [Thrips palmi]
MRPLVANVVVGVVAAVVAAAVTAGIILGTLPGCADDAPAALAVDMMRPAFHYTPRFGWVNDPNGLVYADGEWHLFYQADYETTLHGNMSWGHAVSTDLVHWQELGVAISYDQHEQIFSGSAVVDKDCTSGLCAKAGEPVMIAIYTSYDQVPDPNSPLDDQGHSTNRHFQSQHIASSTDRGRTWTKYAHNPVLDKKMYEFRDPKVSRRGDHWLMLVQKSEEHVLQFYKSSDLIKWGDGKGGDGPAGEFTGLGATGGVWECPDMFELPVDGDAKNTKWVLIVNINPGSRFGWGSAAQFFIGQFDGDTFHADGDYSWLDWGADNYATITWDSAPNGEVVAIGWMSNWQYTQVTPASTWRNAFTVPRLLELVTIDGKVRVVQNPVKNIDSLRDLSNAVHQSNLAVANDYTEPAIRGRALDIVVEFDAGSAAEFGVKVYQGEHQETLIGYDKAKGQVFIDRRISGTVNFDALFPDRHSADLPLVGNKLKLRILVDHGSVEVFANRGEVAITDVIFPDPFKDGVSFYALNGTATVVSVDVYPMKTIHGLL